MWPSLRFRSPLIEPDVRISRIRLSDQLHGKTHDWASSSCHKSLLGSVWRIVVLLGSSPIAAPRLLHKHAGSEDPSLRRHYPVSTVLRSSPTPVRPAVLATALGHARPRQVSPDNPHCLASVLCPLPRRIGSGARARFPSLLRSAFPVAQSGRHPHRYFRGCSGFTHVTARWLAQPPTGDLCHKAPARSVTRASRLSATRSNRLLSRWNLPPLATRAYGAHCATSPVARASRAPAR